MVCADGMMLGWRVTSHMRLVLPALLLICCASQAQDRFPNLIGEFVDGRPKEFPGSPKGAIVIGIAVSTKAQGDLETWYEPAYLRFVAKHGLFASAYDADVFFVPLFIGLNKASYEPSLRKFRKSASPEVVDRIVFAKADSKEMLDALGIKDRDAPYFFVVAPDGTILSRAHGRYTVEKLENLEEALLDQ
jgi:hypothetical protein